MIVCPKLGKFIGQDYQILNVIDCEADHKHPLISWADWSISGPMVRHNRHGMTISTHPLWAKWFSRESTDRWTDGQTLPNLLIPCFAVNNTSNIKKKTLKVLLHLPRPLSFHDVTWRDDIFPWCHYVTPKVSVWYLFTQIRKPWKSCFWPGDLDLWPWPSDLFKISRSILVPNFVTICQTVWL